MGNHSDKSDLDEDTLALFVANQLDYSSAALERECLPWLSVDERAKYERFQFPQHRKEYLLGQSLVRTALSEYSETAPEEWRFELGEYGKPAVHSDQNTKNCYFNLSHSAGLIVVAVSMHEAVGVDIERNTRERRIEQIAHRHFAAPEVSALLALPEDERQARFYSLWTLKEAYIKAKGMGLAISLQKFGFDFLHDTGQELQFWVDETLGDDPGDWQFWQLEAIADFDLAVAVATGNSGSIAKIEACKMPSLNEKLPLDLHVICSC